VGPQEQRPRRLELAWYAGESNCCGTNEFLRYCELSGIEPYICVNTGSGMMDEAQAWVEYCNGAENTCRVNLRRQHRRSESCPLALRERVRPSQPDHHPC